MQVINYYLVKQASGLRKKTNLIITILDKSTNDKSIYETFIDLTLVFIYFFFLQKNK